MITLKKDSSLIPQILKQYLNQDHVFFVFATDIALNSWVEWCITNPSDSGVKAVATEQFIPWDKFKERFITAKKQGMHAIPAVLRKVFVYNLIKQNSENQIFNSIINPSYAKDAYSFADWISGNLPQLKKWHDRFITLDKSILDDEDNDYLILYERYKDFLGQSMFEPAWETPDFNVTDDKYIIFYPEQLEDFDDYETVLKSADNVTCVKLPDELNYPYYVYCYKDSRSELRRTALYVRNLIDSGRAKDWSEIAVHVPDLSAIRPYIDREFKKYCIPHVIRAGQSLTINSAGDVFNNIRDCIADNFSFDSVRTLLLNEYIPWKERAVNLSLVRKGSELHCICNYSEQKDNDVWIKALGGKREHENEYIYYVKLRKHIESIYKSTDFESLQTSWFIFKKEFLREDGFSKAADNILGRCLTELSSLIQLEKDFIKPLSLCINNHFDFYLNEISGKSYRPQETITGVNVFDYKVAACAAYKFNIVINCTQNALSVTYRPMSFLNSKKRSLLGVCDSDYASRAFIRLYGKSNNVGCENTIFSTSEQTFSGFAIPHSFFQIREDKSVFTDLDRYDFNVNEKSYLVSGDTNIHSLSSYQVNEFNNWKFFSDFAQVKQVDYVNEKSILDKIDYVLCKNRSDSAICNDGKGLVDEKALHDLSVMKITQADMNMFFPCQRKWLLRNVLKLKEDSLDINLLDPYAQGNINHKILELLFSDLKKLPVSDADGSFGNDNEKIESLVRKYTKAAIDDKSMSFADSPLALDVLHSQEEKFVNIILSFLRSFCSQDRYAWYTVYALEHWMCGMEKDKPYALSGKIDCIVCSDDEESNIAIVDYKNNALPTKIECNVDNVTQRLNNFQCGMYVKLWNLNKPSIPVSIMGFNSIRQGKEIRIIEEGNDKSNMTCYEPSLDALGKYTDRFYDAVSHGDFVPKSESDCKFNDVDVHDDCFGCDFKTVCRYAYSVAGHNIEKKGAAK